jgi:hypothetical protein
MTQSSKHPHPVPAASQRERIDALLDEALRESFPASDSSAIGTGIAAIKQERRESGTADETTQPADIAKRNVANDATRP